MSLTSAYTIFEEADKEARAWFEGEVKSLRTGRVTPATVSDIQVEHYGARTPLQGVGSVASLDARTLQISPWDATAIPAIQKALTEANLGAQPVVDGKVIRLSFPLMSEEVREETIKKLHKKAEEAKIRLRQARDESLSILARDRKDGEITEDEFYDGRGELNRRIDEVNKSIDDLAAKKEKEIRTV